MRVPFLGIVLEPVSYTHLLDAAWIGTVRVEVTNLGNDTLTTYIDMLCIATFIL